MSRVSKGVMTITLNDNEYTLKATIAAIEAIENRFQGGMVAAAQACVKLSFQDAAYILSKAASLKGEDVKRLKQDILVDGVQAAAEHAADYLQMLINPEEAEAEEGDASGEE
ncbi:MAG: hypothetical protein AAGI88_09090 [Pseudomonadota bacterium]